MSLSQAEFRAGVSALAGGAPLGGPTDADGRLVARMPVAEGAVELSYQPLPPRTLGGLLQLPQAEVALSFHDVAPAEQAAFERRFWITFQRGGG